MFMFHIQALYNVFTLFFSWFALANLWLTFSIIIELLPQATGIYVFGTNDIVSNFFGLDRPLTWQPDALGQPGIVVDLHGIPGPPGEHRKQAAGRRGSCLACSLSLPWAIGQRARKGCIS